MDILIPNEVDFKRRVTEALRNASPQMKDSGRNPPTETEESLLARNDVAKLFYICLITLHDGMDRGFRTISKGVGCSFSVPKSWRTSNKSKDIPMPFDNIPLIYSLLPISIISKKLSLEKWLYLHSEKAA